MRRIELLTLTACCYILISSCNGGNGNTSAASAKADVTSGSGSDVYIEMANTTSGKKMQMQGKIRIYLAADGKIRTEMAMTVNGKPSGVIVAIGDASRPYQSTVLDDSAKTYYVNQIDSADMGHAVDQAKYIVSKIGEEKITGFNCTHAQVIATKNYSGAASFMNSIDTTDLWLSPDVPLPASAKKYMDVSAGKMSGALFSNDVTSQLKKMGCEGFMVKFAMHSKDVNSVSGITKVSHDNFPSNMFEVPSGYKQTNE